MTSDPKIDQAVARVARDSCRRLVAFLASRSGNVGAAEDALSEALQAALETWPRSGLPHNPEAWLLTTARRRLIDAYRHDVVRAEAAAALLTMADEVVDDAAGEATFPDERLKLMFVCTHPALDLAIRTPLMLQVVFGLDAGDIASTYLVKPAAMGQRLSRAKTKIRDARIPYEVPEASVLPQRIDAVLQAIYGIYGIGWDDLKGAEALRGGFAQEAIELCQLLNAHIPRQAEVLGLLALMLHCEARRPARRAHDGTFTPLDEQDTRLWQQPLIDTADGLLQEAASLQQLGRFQLEAAIQSVHAQRSRSGVTDWPSIAALYDGLAQLSPTVGVGVARASAWAKVHGAEFAFELLDQLPLEPLANYQPYWALRGQLLREQGRRDEAIHAYERAMGLCIDPAARAYLLKQALSLKSSLQVDR
jgi:RNA polymerase sigma-70 factor (ECF subfamily)